MSAETFTESGERISWGNAHVEHFEIGDCLIRRADFHLAALEVLAGEKEVTIPELAAGYEDDRFAPTVTGELTIKIPDDCNGSVTFGELELPYPEFMHGMFWSLTQGRNEAGYADRPSPLGELDRHLLNVLREQTMSKVPDRNQGLLDAADRLRDADIQPDYRVLPVLRELL